MFPVGTARAAVLTFTNDIIGQTSYVVDVDNDGIDDVRISTTDPGGFNSIGPGLNQTYIQEPGLEGTSLQDPDLRIEFLAGALRQLSFAFALLSDAEGPGTFASVAVYDIEDNLLGTSAAPGLFTMTQAGTSSFPEGILTVNFAGTASYGHFNFSSDFGRYIIDNVEGAFGASEIPEPWTAPLVIFGTAMIALRRAARWPCWRK
jgi:hypothetical protein